MDDLNRKRLEKGEPLSTHGKSEDEISDMLTEACQAQGFNGRTYSGPQENPVGRYRLSRWQPFGEFPKYEAPTEVAKLIGYQLVTTQRHEGWFHLYFDADEDRGGCFRRVDILDDEVGGIVRSDVLDGGIVNPLSDFTRVQGEVLSGVEAYRSRSFVLEFESGVVERRWDCPLDPTSNPENPVKHEEGKADFERPFVALQR